MDLSQEALAEKVGVSRQTINAIEKGDYNPTIKLCISICKVLNKTLDELFWEEQSVLVYFKPFFSPLCILYCQKRSEEWLESLLIK